MKKTKGPKWLLIPLLLLSLLATLLLAACDPPVTRGYVYDKQYQPAYSYYVPGYSTRSCSKKSCYTYYHPGYVVYEPAEYWLKLTTCGSLETTGQCNTGWVEVDSYTFNHTNRGDYYPEGGN